MFVQGTAATTAANKRARVDGVKPLYSDARSCIFLPPVPCAGNTVAEQMLPPHSGEVLPLPTYLSLHPKSVRALAVLRAHLPASLQAAFYVFPTSGCELRADQVPAPCAALSALSADAAVAQVVSPAPGKVLRAAVDAVVYTEAGAKDALTALLHGLGNVVAGLAAMTYVGVTHAAVHEGHVLVEQSTGFGTGAAEVLCRLSGLLWACTFDDVISDVATYSSTVIDPARVPWDLECVRAASPAGARIAQYNQLREAVSAELVFGTRLVLPAATGFVLGKAVCAKLLNTWPSGLELQPGQVFEIASLPGTHLHAFAVMLALDVGARFRNADCLYPKSRRRLVNWLQCVLVPDPVERLTFQDAVPAYANIWQASATALGEFHPAEGVFPKSADDILQSPFGAFVNLAGEEVVDLVDGGGGGGSPDSDEDFASDDEDGLSGVTSRAALRRAFSTRGRHRYYGVCYSGPDATIPYDVLAARLAKEKPRLFHGPVGMLRVAYPEDEEQAAVNNIQVVFKYHGAPLSSTQRWNLTHLRGYHNLLEALSFLQSKRLYHGNVGPSALYVAGNGVGDFFLGGFDFAVPCSDVEGDTLDSAQRTGVLSPPEVVLLGNEPQVRAALLLPTTAARQVALPPANDAYLRFMQTLAEDVAVVALREENRRWAPAMEGRDPFHVAKWQRRVRKGPARAMLNMAEGLRAPGGPPVETLVAGFDLFAAAAMLGTQFVNVTVGLSPATTAALSRWLLETLRCNWFQRLRDPTKAKTAFFDNVLHPRQHSLQGSQAAADLGVAVPVLP